MNKEELWIEYVRQNPAFGSDGNVKISVKSLRKLFDLTWDTACRYKSPCRDKGEEMFNSIFGGFGKK